jgi:hypothetical protein
MFAGTASALQYHALDPQAKLLTINHMPKPLFKSLLPPELRERIIYYRCDMAKISPSKYRRILRQCLSISPEQLTTAHASPPCRTLSIASRNKEAEPHFVENRPNSTIAKADYDMLERTLETIDQCHPAGSNTVISLENPVGRFRRLPIVKSIYRSAQRLAHLHGRPLHARIISRRQPTLPAQTHDMALPQFTPRPRTPRV